MTTPGEIIADLPAEDYRADQVADVPTLSASIAHTLLSKSPKHAWSEHPHFNPEHKREELRHLDIGEVVHSLLLEGRENVWVIHADNYRTKVAQEARDEARAHGRIPLLAHEREEAYAMVDAIERQLDEKRIDPRPFTQGAAELTLTWEDSGVMCRCRLDWLRADCRAIDDAKSTTNAEPDHWQRNSLFKFGYDVKAAFYLRGIKANYQEEPEFRWVVFEKKPPYLLSVHSPTRRVLEHANEKVDRALAIWRKCLETGVWGGYPDRVCYVELPGWEETRWLEKEAREEMAA